MRKENLIELLKTPSPSGYEYLATSLFQKQCSEFASHEFTDKIGNCCMSVGSAMPKVSFMISGHIDEVGMQVQYVDDKGFLYVIRDGGIDAKAVLSSNVTVLHGKDIIKGVIGKKAMHVEGDDRKSAPKITDIKIDCGFSSKEEALKHISIGDPVVVDSLVNELGDYRITSKGLDDKVGVFVVTEVLERLSRLELKNVKVFGCACTQEEVGGDGAWIASKRINPDFSIDYDVTFATDDGYTSEKEWGDIKLGSGAAIAHGADKTHGFVKAIKKVCDENNLPYQPFSVHGGTNTGKIRKAASDCQTALISIPQRNMHTQVEVCDYRDIESAVNITVATILKLDQQLG